MVRPRICVVPESASSRGEEAVEFVRSVGLTLDDWQEFVLREMLGVDANGRWAADEVGLTLSRQNGKTVVAVARELCALFLFGDELVIHSAHERPASFEAFLMLISAIEGSADLSSKVKAIRRQAGNEGVDLLEGGRIRYRTRTKGGGRGFACDTLVLDESHTLSDAAMAAMVPMLQTRIGQAFYLGTAVDKTIHEHGAVFTLLRERARSGQSERLFYAEWSPLIPLDEHGREAGPDDLDDEFLDDELNIRAANPALATGRLTLEAIAMERRSLSRRAFAVERLSCGDRPTAASEGDGPFSVERWLELVDEASQPLEPLVLSVDFNPAGRAAFAAAGRREDGKVHAGLVASDLQVEGTTVDTPGSLGEVLRNFVREHVTDDHVLVDERVLRAHTKELIEDATYAMVVPVTTSGYADACDRLVALVNEDRLRHVGSKTLTDSLKVARARPFGDSFLWSRRLSAGDCSPVIAMTLAAAAAADVDGSANDAIQIYGAPAEWDLRPGAYADYYEPLSPPVTAADRGIG